MATPTLFPRSIPFDSGWEQGRPGSATAHHRHTIRSNSEQIWLSIYNENKTYALYVHMETHGQRAAYGPKEACDATLLATGDELVSTYLKTGTLSLSFLEPT